MVAVADGKDMVRVNVFVLDNVGKPVAKKLVSISGMENIKPVAGGISDESGKATFEMTSTVEGVFPVEASIEGISIGKKLSVIFRN